VRPCIREEAAKASDYGKDGKGRKDGHPGHPGHLGRLGHPGKHGKHGKDECLFCSQKRPNPAGPSGVPV
jgi:hypothetical protein